jgi:hypothetical protein
MSEALVSQEIAMSDEAVFTLTLETTLRDQFVAEAEASSRPPSELVRAFMQDFVRQQREAREHSAWLAAEIEQAVREADDPAVTRIPHADVAANWQRQRAALVKRAGGAK